MSEICSKIRELIFETIGIDIPVNSFEQKDSISSLGISSIEFIMLVVGIEKEFGIEFGDEDLDYHKYPTLKALASYLEGKINKGSVVTP